MNFKFTFQCLCSRPKYYLTGKNALIYLIIKTKQKQNFVDLFPYEVLGAYR